MKINRLIKIKSQRGFTIVEMLIYMGLLSIFLLILTDMLVSILNVKVESEASSFVEQDSKFITARLSYDINQASAITTPASLGGSASSLAIVIGGVTYTYATLGGNLQLTNNLGTSNLNSSETTVTSATFQRIGNVSGKETIKINITVQSTIIKNSGTESKVIQTTIGRR